MSERLGSAREITPRDIFDPDAEPDFYLSEAEATAAMDRRRADMIDPDCAGECLHYGVASLGNSCYSIQRVRIL
ncbi:MAG TPA: hypothetical protein VHC21_04630 [Candidatus Saccharimonadales bacterium]|nr:hypothetical protein [Candidatus Saccharimonadales bacterium]